MRRVPLFHLHPSNPPPLPFTLHCLAIYCLYDSLLSLLVPIQKPQPKPRTRGANIEPPCRPLLFQNSQADSEPDTDTGAGDIHIVTDSTISLLTPQHHSQDSTCQCINAAIVEADAVVQGG
ncbi:hypothetical protein BDV09DRAFT_47445 [Aspergillus tetrazonus]